MKLENIDIAFKFFKQSLVQIYTLQEIESLAYVFFRYLGFSKTEIHSKPEIELKNEQIEFLKATVDKLKMQMPIEYILGETEFYGLVFKVNPNVLIPRPETEELVDWIIKDNTNKSCAVIDIGTGSGCIAISLALYLKDSNITGVDVDIEAINIAKQNALNLNCKCQFYVMDILKTNEHENNCIYDIIVSNPPYVLHNEKAMMQPNVLNFEPHLALFVDDDNPLLFYQKIIEYARHQLSNNGLIYFEINESLGAKCIELLEGHGFTEIELRKDMFGKNRMLKAKHCN